MLPSSCLLFNYKAYNLNRDCKGVIAVGGISYGDMLGAGEGWVKTILFNGCQMMRGLKSIIPVTHTWPKFTRNKSEKFKGRFAMIEVTDSHRSSSTP